MYGPIFWIWNVCNLKSSVNTLWDYICIYANYLPWACKYGAMARKVEWWCGDQEGKTPLEPQITAEGMVIGVWVYVSLVTSPDDMAPCMVSASSKWMRVCRWMCKAKELVDLRKCYMNPSPYHTCLLRTSEVLFWTELSGCCFSLLQDTVNHLLLIFIDNSPVSICWNIELMCTGFSISILFV